MKTIVKTDQLINLEVKTTGQEKKDFLLPVENIQYWYPFNVNFSYVYSDAREQLYLVMDKEYKSRGGKDYYGTDILKNTQPLEELNGTMFHQKVYDRNNYIMVRAKFLGLKKTLLEEYTIEDVEQGFNRLHTVVKSIKNKIEARVTIGSDELLYAPARRSEDWDKMIYDNATLEEWELLEEIGEIYSMLSLMRKIKEGV